MSKHPFPYQYQRFYHLVSYLESCLAVQKQTIIYLNFHPNESYLLNFSTNILNFHNIVRHSQLQIRPTSAILASSE